MAEQWKLEGHYLEACNCAVACPCVFLSAPTEGSCTLLVGWHIDKGNLGGVKLDGLNVALAAHAPGHMLETKWKAALYVDEKASEPQKNALIQIFAGQAGGHPAVLVSFVGEVLGVKSVAIDYQSQGKRRTLRIGDVGEADIEALGGQGGANVMIENHPLCIAPGFAAVVAKSTSLRYQDHGYNLVLSNRTGFYSPFSYQGSG